MFKLERLERLWQTRAVDKSPPFPPNFNVALVDKRGELIRYAALAEKLARSKKLCNIEDGGREGGRRAGVCSGVSCSWETFGFPLFARGSFEVRSWLQKRCRCRGGLGGAKLQAAENQRKSVLFFARRVRRGACETSVSGFCRSGRIFAALVCLSKCEVFASELALAEACADPKSGPRGGPKFGAVLPFGN